MLAHHKYISINKWSSLGKVIGLWAVLCGLHAEVRAQPAAPLLSFDSEGLQASLHWTQVPEAVGYQLLYAPYPYQGEATIGVFDMGADTDFSVALWQGAAYYVAIEAYDANGQLSEFSNIGFLQILDRGDDYRNFWRTAAKDIAENRFTSDSFLYAELPNIDTCAAGSLNEAASQRQLSTLNEIRRLHGLSEVEHDPSADFETQQAALIQRANNFLTHSPPTNSKCYSQAGFNGSNSSNLSLERSNSDPADQIIGLTNDAFNVSAVSSVGHRRHLLNPFLQFNSYGQVFGAGAVKVTDFFDASIPPSTDIPDFVAFPYLRYPYLFFSDKTHDQMTPWNLSVIEDKSSPWRNQYAYFTEASVSVRQKDNGQVMTVQNVFTDTSGFGIPNNLSWNVVDWQYDTWYEVTVDNIRYQSGETGRIHYDVLIDYKHFIDLAFPLEDGDEQNGQFIHGALAEQDDQDSYELDLDNTTVFTGDSQFSNMAFYIRLYGPDKQLVISSDESFSVDLPAGRYTVVIANCDEMQTCYSEPKNYTVQIN